LDVDPARGLLAIPCGCAVRRATCRLLWRLRDLRERGRQWFDNVTFNSHSVEHLRSATGRASPDVEAVTDLSR